MKDNYLYGARIIWTDHKRGFTLAWYGGHGIHIYDRWGREYGLWHVGDFSKLDADPSDVARAMRELVTNGNYRDFC
jgi:hypothetical protein